MLDSLITSKTRLKLLIKFFVSASNQSHLRGLADEFQESTNAIRKELNQLSEAGYLEKSTEKNKILYRANTKHSLFAPLQKLIHTYLGIDEIIDNILQQAGDIQEVSLVGDYAGGVDSGKIDVLVLGENINQAYLLLLADKVGKKLGKQVNLSFQKTIEEQRYIILYTNHSTI
ncbi:ArsR family transcriptional regulator [Sphingobacterium sp. UGAL515B_05]|uniref:ArsR family transcriptional regulator n=1 Tax=Sphingobacterium sp. UGAL515B_05 TaxID=2986767 RepID=UPI00295574B0|nr:ArsR family transcriptional regulator [Sphingobacterium sp. UGAL515B_05]WON96159.1 ArsR family transcriptional regulator [Sphingobacterium sp. UGAL515B_05]